MTPQSAQEIALQALSFIAADPDLSGHFLSQSGASAADLRKSAGDPAFLGFVLDFLMMDDSAVIGFATQAECDPNDIATARAHLPGGDAPNWT